MQTSVDNTKFASGIAGEESRSGFADTIGAILDSTTESYNVPGAVVVNYSSSDPDVVGVASDGNLAGLLCCPKNAVRDSLEAVDYLDNSQEVSVARAGYRWVTLTTTAAVGDFVYYSTTTGALATFDPDTAPDDGYSRLPGGKVVDFTVSTAGLASIYFDCRSGSTETPSS